MRELASKGQLRFSYIRWAVFVVPLVVLLGFLSGRVAPSGDENPWYLALAKPDWQPPGWAFGTTWTILYILMGAAVAIVLNARGARGRGVAIVLFAVQLATNLAWAPLFFGAHLVSAAVIHIIVILALALATTFAFGRIRPLAAWLLVPYLGWLCFATLLAWEIDRLNPAGETLVPDGARTQIQL